MRILFWGTPQFAVSSLRALDDEGYEVVGVVTQPDRPAGRGRKLTPSPVKEAAEESGFPVLAPERPVGGDFLAALRALAPELSVVVAYGHILRREVLDVPPLGSLNVHASLLPELRGAAPINWAIARGHDETGVSIMRMVEAMDAGPVLHRIREPILPGETASELSLRLSELGAEALLEALALLDGGAAVEEEQEHARATYAPKVGREVARLDWSRPAREIAWHIRGMDSAPGAWSELDGVPVKLFRPTPMEASLAAEPGTVLAADAAHGLVVAAGDGAVALGEVQPPGKRRMDVQDWIHGRGVRAAQRFA
ncbi:MAG: methionyl-tRNA formyltransferase [Gemmatimonadetes bacterium]|nr:methionyl-tRNA formyltransferase [Gemmatimonadota bacterium]